MLRFRCFPFVFALTCLCAARTEAHPHEFIDTSITFRTDSEGRLGAIGVIWLWDDLTSMLIIEDLGMDPDSDGALTNAETLQLADRFSHWPANYGGDLYVTHGGQTVDLSGPLEVKADLLEGRLFLSYLGALPVRLGINATPVVLQAFDPSYYVFYDLAGTPEVRGRKDCHISIEKADLQAAQKLYDQLLGQLTEEELMEQGKHPEMGGAFADKVLLACDASP